MICRALRFNCRITVMALNMGRMARGSVLLAALAAGMLGLAASAGAQDPSFGEWYNICKSCDENSDNCGCPPPRCPWYVRTDGVMLMRDVRGNTGLASLNAPNLALATPPTVIFATSEIDGPFRAAPQFLIGHTFGDSIWQIEGSYMFAGDWDASTAMRNGVTNALGSAGNLMSPFTLFGKPAPVAGYDYNNLVSVREFSRMQTAEVNLKGALPMTTNALAVSFLFGVRYMSIAEQFDYHSESAVPSPLGSAFTVNTRTNNELIGPQIGGLFEFWVYQGCWINFEMKGALCNNSSFQDSEASLTTAGVTTPGGNRVHRDGTSVVGELGLSFVYRPLPNLTTRLGYRALWVESVTLGARNFNQQASMLMLGPGVLDNRGSVVYHGPHAGLEFSW
jgi:hypothetical protein